MEKFGGTWDQAETRHPRRTTAVKGVTGVKVVLTEIRAEEKSVLSLWRLVAK